MDYKKSNAPVNTVTRNVMDLCEETGNIYESVAIIGKRANQIAGKGHENYQDIKGVKHHFDDKEVVKEIFGLNN